MFVKGAVAVIEPKVLFRIIAGARVTGIRRWRQPDQVKAATVDADRKALNNGVPVFVAIIRKLFRVTVPIGFPISFF